MILVFPLLRALASKKTCSWILLLCITAVIVGYVSIFHSLLVRPIEVTAIRFPLLWLPFPLVGIWLARGVLPHVPIAWTMLLLGIPIEAAVIRNHGIEVGAYLRPIVMSASIVAVVALVQHESFGSRMPSFAGKIVRLVSENTLAIFLMNPLLIHTFHKIPLVVKEAELMGNDIARGATALIVTALCILLALLLKRVGLGKLVSG